MRLSNAALMIQGVEVEVHFAEFAPLTHPELRGLVRSNCSEELKNSAIR